MNLDRLTVVVLTRNEEDALPEALASLPRGVRVLVVDAESTDRTQELARAAGATVIERRWTDFVDARRFALAQVATPWTFMLDADERLDSALREALVKADPEEEGVDAYRLRRATRFCGATISAFGWDNERLVRIFRTARATLSAHPAAGGNAPVHERWDIVGRLGDLAGTLVHESYPDRATYRRKFAAYTALEAAQARTGTFRVACTLLVFPFRLLWLLGPRGGLRAGWRGVYLGFWSALYPLAVYWKARKNG